MTPTCKSCIHPCKYEREGWCPNHTTRLQAEAIEKEHEHEKTDDRGQIL